MAERKFETTAAFKELIDLVRDSDALFLEGPRAVDAPSVLEGYRWLTEILSVALDCYLWADDEHPTLRPDRRADTEVRRRQRRRHVLLRAAAPRPQLPHPRRARRRLLSGAHRVWRTARRALVGSHRRHAQRPRDPVRAGRLLRGAAFRAGAAGPLDPARPGQRVRGHARLSRAPESGTPRELHDRVPRHAAAAAALGRGSRAPLPRRRKLHPRHAQDHAAAARPCEAQPDRRALPGAAAHVRLGGGRRRLCDGKLRARRGRGARDRGQRARPASSGTSASGTPTCRPTTIATSR